MIKWRRFNNISFSYFRPIFQSSFSQHQKWKEYCVHLFMQISQPKHSPEQWPWRRVSHTRQPSPPLSLPLWRHYNPLFVGQITHFCSWSTCLSHNFSSNISYFPKAKSQLFSMSFCFMHHITYNDLVIFTDVLKATHTF